MPGPQIKDWDKYHALRKEGKSKEEAARIANAGAGDKKVAKVTAKDRKKTGIKGTKNESGQKKFPVNSKAQALSAIRLRHHGHGVSASAVLAHVARSKFGKDPQVKAAIERARERDRKRKS